ncbi:hypothetical protein [Tahibacter aquaticus]|nr:hypothetical protein [Tahibacter aquaticus]
MTLPLQCQRVIAPRERIGALRTPRRKRLQQRAGLAGRHHGACACRVSA